MATSGSSENVVLALDLPEVLNSTRQVVGADRGVPLSIYDLVEDGKGATVRVSPPLSGTMDPGDVINLWLVGDGAFLDYKIVEDPNAITFLRIPLGRLHPDRVNELYYTITRNSGNIGTSTPPLTLLYNKVRPGLEDASPGDGKHSRLELLLPDAIKYGVGPEFVSAQVCVRYPYCRAYDTITLKCNSQLMTYEVRNDQAPQPPDPGSAIPTSVCFTVTRPFLDSAQRPSNELEFSYTVTDQLRNTPDTVAIWSASYAVDEDLEGTRLPGPILREKENDPTDEPGIIDLEKLGINPLLLIVPTADPRIHAGDKIQALYTAKVGDQPDVEVPATGIVDTDEFGQKRTCVLKVANDKVFVHSTVTASFQVLRGEEVVAASRTAAGRVIGEIVIRLDIVGHRSQTGPHYHSNRSRLVASASAADEIIWTYADEAQGVSGLSFIDDNPEKTLIVTVRKDGETVAQRVLRPCNITGVFNLSGRHSGCITKDDGSVFGWSDSSEMLPPPGLTDVRCVTAGGQAFAALKKNATVFAWGVPSHGGAIELNIEKELINVKELAATAGAFVALLGDGRLVAWGHRDFGGEIPVSLISQLTPAAKIIGNTADFTVLLRDGRVFSWGDTWPNGQLVASAGGATQICASDRAFCALKTNGSIFAWGAPTHGGTLPDNAPAEVRFLASTSAAFGALKVDGSVTAWGNQRFGGEGPSDLQAVTHLTGSTTAFCALKEDGSLVAWGEPGEGGRVPSGLGPALSISASYGSFAAVLNNRLAVSWGVNTSSPSLTPVACAYAAGAHVVLLSADSNLQSVGPNAPDLGALTGLVSYTE
ncbi:hypothetical protein KVG95_27270 [Pseudomonas sp. SWRI79]|uniref:Uncharacterized protein n=1 Tax=Pseudomonas farris TaxID=2841207 RepID=A0ABS6Q2S4_9PSED|nr:hypothetical protein [Pseudomonas farris]MBV4467019.1 hypothetical protein [Pseudomonas farris]